MPNSRFSNTIDWLRQRGKHFLSSIRALRPGESAARGAWIGGLTATLLLAGYTGYALIFLGFGWPLDVLIGIVVGLMLVTAIALGFWTILSLLAFWPKFLVTVLAGAIVVTSILLFFDPTPPGLLVAGGIVLPGAFIGGSIAVFRSRRFGGLSTLRKSAQIGVLALGIAVLLAVLVWSLLRGSDTHILEVFETVSAQAINAPDPSIPGPYTVQKLTYGSGKDRHRIEYGEEATLKTESVDASAFVKKVDGFLAPIRKWWWGFDRNVFPLNGTVWHPDGDGPFPIVLIVHGNHNMMDFSDPGYAYLGELLASRGIITVSVDENFLNSSWMPGYDEENDARGWLLLEHLKQWEQWNDEEENPFHSRVDMNRIALIGHSRGGEAVTEAAFFNRLSHYPDDATTTLDYQFDIQGIIAIAPVDGQYNPADLPTPINDVNYFVIQGGHDADVASFVGDRQYRRAAFSDSTFLFKAGLYVHEANHGQFNSVWGAFDAPLPSGLWINRKALSDGEAQRQVALVYFSAFLEIVLHNRKEYLPLFRDYRTGTRWLPDLHYANRFADSRTHFIADYQEDIDVTTASTGSSHISSDGLALWREEDLSLRQDVGRRDNQVVVLGWRFSSDSTATDSIAGTPDTTAAFPSYTLHFPAVLADTSQPEYLTFALATSDEKPPDEEEEINVDADEEIERGNEIEENVEAEDDDEKSEPEPLDFTVILIDRNGNQAAVPISSIRTLYPPMRSRFTRWSLLEKDYNRDWEAVLQTYLIRLDSFLEINPELNISALTSIRFQFDRSPGGVVYLDEIGFQLISEMRPLE